MYDYTHELLIEAERSSAGLDEVLPALRKLPLDDFGALMFFPQTAFPRLTSLMPPVPDDDVQRNWCGATGETLYLKTSAAVRAIASLHHRTTGEGLNDKRILDYGCGWGRLARMMLYFTDPGKLEGVDAWAGSLSHLKGVPGTYRTIEAVPSTLGVGPADCIYAFSIATHLPPTVLTAMLKACRASASHRGSLLFTVRPKEFWRTKPGAEFAEMESHHDNGFAFEAQTASGLYGDASYRLDFLEQMLSDAGWRLRLIDRVAFDPYHIWICAQAD